MKTLLPIFLWIQFFASFAEEAPPDLDPRLMRSVAALEKGAAKDEEMRKHADELYKGGALAIHALASQLNNEKLTDYPFVSWRLRKVDPESGRTLGWREPTMGDAAFFMITGMLEPIVLPKLYGTTLFIEHKDLADWLKTRRDKSLYQLQMEIAETRLRRAVERAENAEDDYFDKTVRYLEKHLREVQKLNPANPQDSGRA